jgi:outer membrane protein assembly factor BamB
MRLRPLKRAGSLTKWRIPALLLLLAGLALLLPTFWHYADFDPAPLFHMVLLGRIISALCLVGILMWFFGLSGLSVRIRLTALAVLVLAVGGFAASVADVQVDGALRPIFRFRWQSLPAQTHAAFLNEQSDASGLPEVDLTVDSIEHFPRYRGVQADGLFNPSELLDMRWDEKPPREVWRQPCGGGFAGFAVAGNVLVTIEQRGDSEAVVCYDRGSGKQRWVHEYPAAFKHFTGNGPRATPSIADGEVYSLGACGDLVCLDGKTGRRKWHRNILDDAAAKCLRWGMTSSPLVVEDRVIVNAGVDPNNNAGRAVIAYRRRDGEVIWASGSERAGYSSPQLANLCGVRQVLLFDVGGLAGFDLATGQELWRHPWTTPEDMNIIQPVVLERDRVFISSETSNGGAMLSVRRNKEGAFRVEVLWENRNLCAKWANPVRLGSTLYGLSNGTLVCVDVETGKRHWRGKSFGSGQLLGVAGSLIVQSETGEVAVIAPDTRRYREVARIRALTDRTWNTPAVAGRYLYLRNDVEMVCYEMAVRPVGDTTKEQNKE